MKKIAIVNRGEPAVRFLRALFEYNDEHDAHLESVSMYTYDDESAPFVRMANSSVSMGEAMRTKSDGTLISAYCDHEFVLDLLEENQVDAVWPGWGFVSEDYEFVAKCEQRGITFIGPTSQAMQQLGDKIASKYLAESCGVPMAKWVEITPEMNNEQIISEANRIGFPLMVKASAGGGGRGIRKVSKPEDLIGLVNTVKDEVAKIFGQGGLFMEACIVNARHIEVQVLADLHGHAYALGVRDCSIQRKNQKIIEEAPSPILPSDIEQDLCDVSAKLAKLAGYTGVGTVEFLYQPSTGTCSFLEVNSRLQVEHTITEMITDIDLVKSQISIAMGEPILLDQIPRNGHAIELRLNAENPERNFQPSPGRIDMLHFPSGPGIRIDSGVSAGMTISPSFDSMIAKVIVWAPTRKQAISRAKRACHEMDVLIEDGATNQAFLSMLLEHPSYLDGTATTSWLDEQMLSKSGFPIHHQFEALLVGGILEYLRVENQKTVVFFEQVQDGLPRISNNSLGFELDLKIREADWKLLIFRLSASNWVIEVSGERYHLELHRTADGKALVYFEQSEYKVLYSFGRTGIFVEINGTHHLVEKSSGGVIKASSPSVVVALHVSLGDYVEKGMKVCTVEAMKMEIPIFAKEAGWVRSIPVLVNQQVTVGAPLMVLDTDENTAQDVQGQKSVPSSKESILDKMIRKQSNLSEDEQIQCLKMVHSTVCSVLLGYDVPILVIDKVVRVLNEPQHFQDVIYHPIVGQFTDCLEMFMDVLSLTDRNQLLSSGGQSSIPLDMCFTEFCRTKVLSGSIEMEALKPKVDRALRWYGLNVETNRLEIQDVLYRIFSLKTDNERQHTVAGAVVMFLNGMFEQGHDALATDGLHRILTKIPQVTRKSYPFLRDCALQALYTMFQRAIYSRRQKELSEMLKESFLKIQEHHLHDGHMRNVIQNLIDDSHALQQPLFTFAQHNQHLTHRILEILVGRFYSGNPYQWSYDLESIDIQGIVASVQQKGCLSASTLTAIWIRGPEDIPLAVDAILHHPTDLVEVILGTEQLVELDALDIWIPQIPKTVQRCTVSWLSANRGIRHRTFLHENGDWNENALIRDIHPEVALRLELWRLDAFALERLGAHDRVYAFKGVGKHNANDRRIFVFAEVFGESSNEGAPFWEFEKIFLEAVHLLRGTQSKESARTRYRWNWMQFQIHPVMTITDEQVASLSKRLQPHLRGLSVQEVNILGQIRSSEFDATQNVALKIAKPGRYNVQIVREVSPILTVVPEMTPYDLRVLRSKRIKVLYPYEAIKMLIGESTTKGQEIHPDIGSGSFVEYDFDVNGHFVPVNRPHGMNSSGVVCGVIVNQTEKFPEGMKRVWIASDATRAMGALAELECKRLLAAFELAESLRCPVEWIPISAGAKISMDSGTENLDWTAQVLRKIVQFTENGGVCNIIVHGINVGAQSYWNAEATMLMHTKGVLIMTNEGSMVLTGKKALDYSGAVSAEDERGVGGVERIMGPNGQAQYYADNLGDAYRILFEWYRVSYRSAMDAQPRLSQTSDPIGRCILNEPCTVQGELKTLADVFDTIGNRERKKSFLIRDVLTAVKDVDTTYLERFVGLKDGESSVIWDCHIGGWPVCLIGVESTQIQRIGRIPMDGPDQWSGGTLFPNSSKKVARAICSASGNRPLVVLANLSGFDGSPESLRRLQLEYGAEIGRAIVNFDGPIVFIVIGRYHGGAYVVFSKALNPNLKAFAVEGSYASVIGGAPAAAVVFPREVQNRTEKDERVILARKTFQNSTPEDRLSAQQELERIRIQVTLEKQGEVAKQFDQVHSVQRAVDVGSLDGVIQASELRSHIIQTLESFDYGSNRFS